MISLCSPNKINSNLDDKYTIKAIVQIIKKDRSPHRPHTVHLMKSLREHSSMKVRINGEELYALQAKRGRFILLSSYSTSIVTVGMSVY